MSRRKFVTWPTKEMIITTRLRLTFI